MKKIIITGANSYIGTNLEKWLGNNKDEYQIETIDVSCDKWKEESFFDFDIVIHVAGLAHRKETKNNKDIYYEVNRDLASEVARKSKAEGIKQFIFLSSMSVYGLETGIIRNDTPLNPKSNYGASKLQAEEIIKSLESEIFIVSILRPPMVYGNNCKGNYPKLSKLALTIPVFPDLDNVRSMIYIDNLCEFIKLLIDECESGLFFPQNSDYIKTCEMVRLIAEAHGKRIILTKIFTPILNKLKFIPQVNKVFGNLVYDKNMSSFKKNYQVHNFLDSIYLTEGRKI